MSCVGGSWRATTCGGVSEFVIAVIVIIDKYDGNSVDDCGSWGREGRGAYDNLRKKMSKIRNRNNDDN